MWLSTELRKKLPLFKIIDNETFRDLALAYFSGLISLTLSISLFSTLSNLNFLRFLPIAMITLSSSTLHAVPAVLPSFSYSPT